MTPAVVVARSAWQVITRELDRVAPREGVVLPLVALEHRSEAANPCAQIGLADLATIVLAEARCVPPQLQRNSLLHVSALPTADLWADDIVLPLVRRAPRLRAAAYLHSHPFASSRTAPSGGDIDGHMLPLLARNTATGLCASFSFIAHAPPRWRLPCFAMDDRRRVCELGETRVVDDDHPAIRRARHGRAPRFWLRRWRRQLARHGLAVRIDELFDGWTRARIALDAARVVVVLFPLDLPVSAPRYFLIDRRTGGTRALALKFQIDATEILDAARAEAA